MDILQDVLVILALSAVMLYVCHYLRVPSVVGYLLAGLIAGPHALGLVSHAHAVEILAEVGVVFLLFAIGTEFSLPDLLALRRPALLGGSLQMALSIGAGFLAALAWGYQPGPAVFLGFMLALSSTAVVLKVLQERREAEAPHGRVALAVLIFQDIAIVPLMLLAPLLAGRAHSPGAALLTLGAKAVLVLGVVYVSARWIAPFLLKRIAATRNNELFLLAIVGLCFSIAWLTWRIGLSLPLGAFLAGLIVSGSAYSHQALARILPFRDVFSSLFFVSIGMLLDVQAAASRPLMVLGLCLGVLAVKAFLAGGVVQILGYPLRAAALTGLALCQVGEFSFILAQTGLDQGLLVREQYQMFLSVAVPGMALTPFIMALAPRVADLLEKLPLPGPWLRGIRAPAASSGHFNNLSGHLVIIGFGLSGRNLARGARTWDIPYVILEMNPETVLQEQAAGEPMVYGDASYPALLEHLGVPRARAAAVAISDPAASKRTVQALRQMNPDLYIAARCRFLSEREELLALGASEVIPEEFETSVELFSRVLARYHVPRAEVERFISEVRTEGYDMLRTMAPASACPVDLRLPDVEIARLRLEQGCPAHGKSIKDLALRKSYGVTVLALRREGRAQSNPGAAEVLLAGDSLLVVGTPEQISAVTTLFKAGT